MIPQEKTTGGLNPRQNEAVRHSHGPLLILAGAGSGKTRVITHRIAHLISELGAKPWGILALTFTNKAAEEMRERTASMIGDAARKATLCTFHSFCHMVLTRAGARVGLANGFSVLDDDDQIRLTKKVMRAMSVPDNSSCSPEKAHYAISYAKNFRESPSEFLSPHNPLSKWVDEIHERYEKALLENNAVDFDNIILKTLDLFEQNADVLEDYRRRYRHILVDEYQDTNRSQFMLLRLLAGDGTGVTAVGDHDQSIYKWRGADISNIVSFEKEFPGATVLSLEQNYRSSNSILSAANSLIRFNSGYRGKQLWSELGEGRPVRFHRADDERGEADFIADEITFLTSKNGTPHSGIAILMRTRAQSRVFEEIFGVRGIPYQVVGITGFYQRKEIKDVIAYLRLICNPRDLVALARIANTPKRGIGDKTIEKIASAAEAAGGSSDTLLDSPLAGSLPPKALGFLKTMRRLRSDSSEMPFVKFLEHTVKESGYGSYLDSLEAEEAEARRENVRELQSVAIELEKSGLEVTLESFLSRVSLLSDVDSLDKSLPTVKLMTLHSAKGLEFPAVFITGLEEGLLPHHSSINDREELEEERRLCYVGATRAMQYLCLTCAESRLLFGSYRHNFQSRFISEMDMAKMEIIEDSDLHGDVRGFFEDRDEAGTHEAPLFPAKGEQPLARNAGTGDEDFRDGDKVLHATWGEGRVLSVKDEEIRVVFKTSGVKRLAVRFAPLKKI